MFVFVFAVNAEDRMRARTRAASIVTVAASAVVVIVVPATVAAVVVAALAADVTILFALVAANLASFIPRQRAVRAISATFGAKLTFTFANLACLFARDLAGANAALDALAIPAVVVASKK
jgi:hypothetical protein